MRSDGRKFVIFNFQEIAETAFIGSTGKISDWTPLSVFTHEMIHAVKGLSDNEQDNSVTPGADYVGDVVQEEKKILAELELNDIRNSYEAVITGPRSPASVVR